MIAAVITVSDRVSRGEAEDVSGPTAAGALRRLGFEVADVIVVPDGIDAVSGAILAQAEHADLVVTTGGTGFAPRDLTPEATTSVIERFAPGIAEAMRAVTFGVNPHGMLSRGVAGIRGSTLIVNLPGSVGGVRESLDVIGPALGHAVGLLLSTATDHNTSTS